MIVVEVSRQWSIRGPSKEDPAGKAENKKSRWNGEKTLLLSSGTFLSKEAVDQESSTRY